MLAAFNTTHGDCVRIEVNVQHQFENSTSAYNHDLGVSVGLLCKMGITKC